MGGDEGHWVLADGILSRFISWSGRHPQAMIDDGRSRLRLQAPTPAKCEDQRPSTAATTVAAAAAAAAAAAVVAATETSVEPPACLLPFD